jgi:Lon-like protease
MTLFDGSYPVPEPPEQRRPASTRVVVGVSALSVALVILVALSFLPTSYVIQQPGPVYNTLGTVTTEDDTEVPLISVDGAETYPTDGSLDLTTVQLRGDPQHRPTWLELALAWLDPSRAVVPIEAVYPEGQTSEQRNEQNASLMVDSQKDATAAALTQLGYDIPSMVRVVSLTDGSASDGELEPDDIIRAVDGTPVTDVDQLRAEIQKGEGAAVELSVDRGGRDLEVSVTPDEVTATDGSSAWVIGIVPMHDYVFPFDVTIQLNNVGGPSAGQMFALGIIDVLTPGEINGGKDVAGTGTISSDGVVGPIGGIRQKLYGARDAGADYFLAPESNCDEVVGHIPDGLQVFSVGELDDSLAALDAIATGEGLEDLATCTAD